MLDLLASLNPVAPDAGPVAARHLDALRRYPDPAAAAAALAGAIGVDPCRLLLTNGGAEAIALVAAELGGHVVEPKFSLHPRRPDGPRWRSNPHSPTGRHAFSDQTAGVWDEAFYALATGHWTRGDADRGAVVVGPLTKLFACPGLRLGYVLAPDADLAGRLVSRQPRWAVNSLAAAALPSSSTGLTCRAGRPPSPSCGPTSPASWRATTSTPALRRQLGSVRPRRRPAGAPHAVLVRDCASFDLPGHARVAVPDRPGLDRLAAALRATA